MKDNEYYIPPLPREEQCTLQVEPITKRSVNNAKTAKQKRRQRKALQDGMSKSAGLIVGAVACVMVGTAVAEPTVVQPVVQEAQAATESSTYWSSSWAGVWEGENGDIFVIICYETDEEGPSGINACYYDTDVGASFTIHSTADEVDNTEIHTRMCDPNFNYDASHDFVLLEEGVFLYSEEVNGFGIETDMGFIRTTDPAGQSLDALDDIWQYYFDL